MRELHLRPEPELERPTVRPRDDRKKELREAAHFDKMRSAALLLAVSVGVFAGGAAADSTIYIIRHGEKTNPIGCLSAAGKERADALPSIFNSTQFRTPAALFATFYDDHIDCERCTQTVTPISTALGLPINNSYGYNKKLGGNTAAAAAMLATLKAGASPILTAWEHVNIQYLTADLGVAASQIPSWSGADYDTVYELTFDGGMQLAGFKVSAENFHPSAAAAAAAVTSGGGGGGNIVGGHRLA